MEAEIEYYEPKNETVVTEAGFRYLDNSTSVVVRTSVWKEKTKEDMFRKMDAENNRLRYCNGSYYKFRCGILQKESEQWYNALSENTRFNMFYSGGIVD